MKCYAPQSLAIVITWLVLAGPAHAQPSYFSELSLDALVLNANTLVVATITDFKEGKEDHELSLAVEETLRGRHVAKQRVLHKHSIWRFGVGSMPASRVEKWKDQSSRLLVALEGRPARPRALIDLSDKQLTVYRSDLTTLHKPEDVLRAAREIIRQNPGVRKVDAFGITLPIEGGYFGSGGSTTIEVPVDERLEKRAQEYVRAMDAWKRHEGARALLHFKSEENIARLKPLLTDTQSQVTELAEQNGGIEVRGFPIRTAAYETLEYWGVKVEKPVLREEVQRGELSISQIMLKAHQPQRGARMAPDQRVIDGKATDAEKKKLLELYEALARAKPPHDAADWKKRTTALVEAMQAVIKGDEKGVETFTKAVDC